MALERISLRTLDLMGTHRNPAYASLSVPHDEKTTRRSATRAPGSYCRRWRRAPVPSLCSILSDVVRTMPWLCDVVSSSSVSEGITSKLKDQIAKTLKARPKTATPTIPITNTAPKPEIKHDVGRSSPSPPHEDREKEKEHRPTSGGPMSKLIVLPLRSDDESKQKPNNKRLSGGQSRELAATATPAPAAAQPASYTITTSTSAPAAAPISGTSWGPSDC